MEERRRSKAVEEKEKAIDDDDDEMMVERWKRESINGEGESGHTGGFCVK